MQTVLRYNTPQVTANKGLSLRARAVTNTNRLEVCLAYTGARPNTGMVLVKVELLTGWRAVSLKRLTSQVEDNMVIKHQEVLMMVYNYCDYYNKALTTLSGSSS